jgi:predicted AAA+ superfamily ATPase
MRAGHFGYIATGDGIIYVNGARQCGKSILALQIAPSPDMEYITTDAPSVYAAD